MITKKRPAMAEHFDQPEDGSTTVNSNEPLAKKQWTTDEAPHERLIAALQREHTPVQKEEPQTTLPVKRPVAADYFDCPENELMTTNSDEPLSKKQRIASMEVRSPSNADHIRSSNTDVYISARKSMMVRTYIHSKSKRAETIALLDSGATKNFLNLKYAEWLQLPIKRLPQPRQLFNVDGTENKMG
jgi:hypothetical protein